MYSQTCIHSFFDYATNYQPPFTVVLAVFKIISYERSNLSYKVYTKRRGARAEWMKLQNFVGYNELGLYLMPEVRRDVVVLVPS